MAIRGGFALSLRPRQQLGPGAAGTRKTPASPDSDQIPHKGFDAAHVFPRELAAYLREAAATARAVCVEAFRGRRRDLLALTIGCLAPHPHE